MASYPSGLRDRFAKPLFAGSNPADASLLKCPGGGNGRHYGLKIHIFSEVNHHFGCKWLQTRGLTLFQSTGLN